MYKIGVIGHTPEYLSEHKEIKSLVNSTLELIQHQYGEDLIIQLAGDIGVAEWAADSCIQNKIKYHLFLPFPPKYTEMLWFDDQFHKLEEHFNFAWSTSIAIPKYNQNIDAETRLENYRRLVSNSRFIIVFWNGMKQGTTFESIKYALENNILVINAMRERQMVTNEDIY